MSVRGRLWLLSMGLSGACTGGAAGEGEGDGDAGATGGLTEGGIDTRTGGDTGPATGVDATGDATGADGTNPDSTDSTDDDGTTAGADSTDTAGDSSSESGSTGDDPESGIHVNPPDWMRLLDGLVFRSQLAPLPDGQLALAVTGGLYSHLIELGVDGDDTIVVPAEYTSVALATMDGATGEFTSARLLGQLAPTAPYGMSLTAHDLTALTGGDVVFAGQWTGTTTLFPGSADAHTAVAVQTQTSQAAHGAYDPLYARFASDGDLVWHRRGRTPGPLSETWFNTPRSVDAMPDGGALMSGAFSYPGFVFPDGTPGQQTFNGQNASYFARLDENGNPIWMGRNSENTRVLAVGEGGAILASAPGGTTVFVGAPQELALPGTDAIDVLFAMDADGEVSWTVSVDPDGNGLVDRGARLDDGTFVVRGYSFGDSTTIVDAVGASHVLDEIAGPHQWLLALDGESGAGTVTMIPENMSLQPVAVADGDRVWFAATLYEWEGLEVEVDGEVMPLPDLGWATDAYASVLLAVDAQAATRAVQVVGEGLYFEDVVLRDGGFTMLAKYLCDQPAPRVIDTTGSMLEALPTACDSEPDESQAVILSTPQG